MTNRSGSRAAAEPRVWVDADACPVKPEIYRVTGRHGLPVTLVANAWMRVPTDSRIVLQVVEAGMDEADDWIVERLAAGDVVVTADIPLASRCVEKGAHVLGPTGRPFTEDNVGDALATRDLLTELRSGGEPTSGPPPFRREDRSRFLQKLEETIQTALRQAPRR